MQTTNQNQSKPQSTKKRSYFSCRKCGLQTDALPATERSRKELCRDCFGKNPDRRPKDLNELSGKEWAAYSRSVEEYPDTRSKKQKEHGACFPLSLAKQQIEIYTKSRALVLDPFVGVGTTMDAAKSLNRRGVGIDINKSFAAQTRRDLKDRKKDFLIRTGDARNLRKFVNPSSVDFILTSPPYADLLRTIKGDFAFKWREHSTLNALSNPAPYSEKPNDLGNLDYEDFLNAISDVFSECYYVLKNNAYSVWIVKDFRAVKRGVPYVNFHGHIIEAAEASGFTLWDIKIYDQTRFRPLVCLGYPSKNYYLNIGHSYIIVLRKIEEN